ncbi:hypothetical protein FHX08_004213 [Rhizobium sp. BK529]|nr:hypothetical protein [Rhizobium sp. BK529]
MLLAYSLEGRGASISVNGADDVSPITPAELYKDETLDSHRRCVLRQLNTRVNIDLFKLRY